MKQNMLIRLVLFFGCLFLNKGYAASGPCASGPIQEGSYNRGYSLALQADGYIVACGYSRAATQNILLARYEPNGILDCYFGPNNNGIVELSVGSPQAAYAVIMQSDNKILIAGSVMLNYVNNYIIARYNSDGTPDTTFGTNGMVIRAMGNGGITCLGLQQDGSIIAGGIAVINGIPNLLVMRYTSAGTLDTTFADNGFYITPVNQRASANSLVVQPDDKIVLAGITATTYENFLITRLNADGSLDTGFGVNGVVTKQIGNVNSLESVALDPNTNNIVVSGFVDLDLVVARYTPNGELDTTFNGIGYVVQALDSDSAAYGVAVQPDSKIVAAGFVGGQGVLVARYTPTGDLDTTFGPQGTGLVTILEANSALINAIELQTNGAIVGVGYSCKDMSLYRVTNTGDRDTSFGNDGVVHNPEGAAC